MIVECSGRGFFLLPVARNRVHRRKRCVDCGALIPHEHRIGPGYTHQCQPQLDRHDYERRP